jgi:hypothetical protein
MARQISMDSGSDGLFIIDEFVDFTQRVPYGSNEQYPGGGCGSCYRVRIVTKIDEAKGRGMTMVQPVSDKGITMPFHMPEIRWPMRNFEWNGVSEALDGHDRVYDFMNSRYNSETAPEHSVDLCTGENLNIFYA